jgi:spore germination protein GerM
MTARGANVLTGVGLLGLLAAVALTAPRWAGVLRAPAATIEEEAPAEANGAPARPQAGAQAARRINVRLYFEWAEQDGLGSEEREVAFSSDLAQQVRTVVEEMAKGPTTAGLVPTLPAGTRVLEVFVRARGVVYVNLSGEARAGLPGGSRAELLTVYSLVNTIVTNFPSTSRVQILVDDQTLPSLGGHVDLSRALPPDMTLVALPPHGPTAEGGPAAEASGAGSPAAAGAATGGSAPKEAR